jgi:phage terminase large subunit-like protein
MASKRQRPSTSRKSASLRRSKPKSPPKTAQVKKQSNKVAAATPSEDDPVTAYAEAVLAGTIVAGPHVRNSCRRHMDDLRRAARPGAPIYWDLKAALHVFGFFKETLCLNGGQFEGVPFELHPSQQFILGSIFGWKQTSDGKRRFRRAYIEEGKGNGKSPFAAGIGMYCLVGDSEPRAEVYAAASKKDQAMVLFRDAVAMVQQSPGLAAVVETSGRVPVWNLAYHKRESFFRPIASEDGQSGPRPHCALCDEIHEHRDGNTLEMLERGFKFREQPLLLMITNSGSDRNSVCWQEHQHAIRVAAGTMAPDETFQYVGEVIDDTTFSYVCALDKDDDPLEDSSCWIKVNPLLGVTIKEDYLTKVVKQAKQIPGKLNGILRLHFCVWTDADTAWMSRTALEACLADFDPATLHAGKAVKVGGDLSGSQDLTALAFVVETGMCEREREGKMVQLPTYDAWIEAWTPKDTIVERSLRDQAPYEVWAQGGWLYAVPGRNIRLDFVVARLAEANSTYGIELFAYDRYAFSKLEQEMNDMGLTIPCAEHPQGGMRRAKLTPEQIEQYKQAGQEAPKGLWMPGSLVALETLILEERIRLRRSPVLISAMMSATVERDAFDNRWFSKRKAVNRIDPLVALAMAVGAAEFLPTPKPKAMPYKDRGLLII